MGVGEGGEKEREGERRGGEKRERKTVGEKVGQEEETEGLNFIVEMKRFQRMSTTS